MYISKVAQLTELGAIPADWLVVELKSIARVIRGASPRPKGDPRYYGGKIPRLMVEDITRDKHWVTPQVDFLTVEGAKLSRLCKRGTIAVVCSGTPSAVGLPAILAVDACIHDGILGLVNLSKNVSTEFVFHKLRSYQHELHAAATHGGTFVNLTTFGFSCFKLVLPPSLAEQEAIAEALSDADAWIESLEQLIAKKRQIKQGAMQELLTGKRRLPGFSGEWKVFRFDQLFSPIRNASCSRADLSPEGDVAYVHYGDIHVHPDAFMNPFELGTYIPFEKARGVPRLIDGDLLMADASEDTSAIGKAVELFGLSGREVIAGLHTLALRGDKKYLADGFKGFIQQLPGVHDALVRLATGVSVYGITKTGVKAIEVRLPAPEEQVALATVLSEMDAEIAGTEHKLRKARQLKQAMMQELLTGRIRLVNPTATQADMREAVNA